jgi:predicted ester cyclase
MGKLEIVRKAWDASDPNRHSYLADDFQWTDELGSPAMDRASWIGMGNLMEAAIPDLQFFIEDLREDGDDVLVSTRFRGTFTNDFDLSAVGMGVVPATGKAVDIGPNLARVSFEGDKISGLHALDTGRDAGMAELLKALGAEPG